MKRIFLFGLLFFSTALLVAQEKQLLNPIAFFDEHKRWYNGFTEAWFQFFDIPEPEVRNSIEHWEQIGVDLKKPTHPSSGTYSSGGDTHGTYLRWSQEKGFVWLTVDKCQGGPMKILRGRVEVVPEGVTLIPENTFGNMGGHSGHGNRPSAPKNISLVSVKWMNTVFLVGKENMVDFSHYAAGLGEYNGEFTYMFDNPYLMMMGDTSESNRFQLPIYPTGYEKFLMSPIRGSVTAIGKAVRRVNPDSDSTDYLITPLTLRLESTKNLKAGLNLHAVSVDEGFNERFKIRSFKRNIATVDHVRWIPKRNCVVSEYEDCKALDHITLRVGLILSSNGF